MIHSITTEMDAGRMSASIKVRANVLPEQVCGREIIISLAQDTNGRMTVGVLGPYGDQRTFDVVVTTLNCESVTKL